MAADIVGYMVLRLALLALSHVATSATNGSNANTSTEANANSIAYYTASELNVSGPRKHYTLTPSTIHDFLTTTGTGSQITSVQSPSVQNTNVLNTSVQITRVQSTSVQSTSVQSTSVQSTSVQSTRVQSTSVQSTSVQSTRVQSTSVQSTSVQSTSVQSTRVQSTSVQNTIKSTLFSPYTLSTPTTSFTPLPSTTLSTTSAPSVIHIAVIISVAIIVLLAIAALVIVCVKMISKRTMHLPTASPHSDTEPQDLIVEPDANPVYANCTEVVNSHPTEITRPNRVSEEQQVATDYIYSVSTVKRTTGEAADYVLPNEIRGAVHTELTESNDYVSALELSMNLGIMPQPPEKAADYIYATAAEGRGVQCVNMETNRNHGNEPAHSESLELTKSVGYINVQNQNDAAAGLNYKPHEEMNIVAERRQTGVEESFVQPATDEWALYAQFKKIKIKLLDESIIKVSSCLGRGQFGIVNKGTWKTTNGPVAVAIKILNPEMAGVDNNKIKFLREVAIMGQFCHPNVVTLHGITTQGETIMMVLELLEKGDLKCHLSSRIPDPKSASSYDGLPQSLLKYCQQIASGMEYLAEKAFIHRDLAARNILVSHCDVCKIADFGMSRDLEDDTYYISKGGRIPLRWTAPEALHFKKYSTASDVWSFGCVMYEIWSMGEKLYTNYSNYNFLNAIESGYRMPPPPGCPRSIYNIMIECWHPSSSNRPSFRSIKQSLFQPDSVLLNWTDADEHVHPQASVIRAPLTAGSRLYEDLQKVYCQ